MKWLSVLMILVSFAHLLSGSQTPDHLRNVSQTIKKLMDGYDIRLRPSFGGAPLYVDLDIVVASFDSISEVNMDYTITIYLNQYWRDERLQYSNNATDQMTLTGDFAEKIWVPDTFFANDKNSFLHDVTERNKRVRLYGDGRIAYGMRFTTTLACMMDLHYYPLDEQNCTVEIESYGYPMEEVDMIWKDGLQSIVGVDKVELPQFSIVHYGVHTRVQTLATGSYKRLSLLFSLRRNIGYFIFQTYLPSCLIVMLSWVSFWINHEATSARVALGITTVLTMTTISTGVRSTLPRISYVKAIDIYLVMCFVFVFAALLEYAAVNYTYWGNRAKKKSKKIKNNNAKIGNNSKNLEAEMESGEKIEMQDIRYSPILSLRNKNNQTLNCADSEDEMNNSHPSYRMQTTVPRASYPARAKGGMGLRKRSTNGSSFSTMNKRKVSFTTLKQKYKELKEKLPSVKDVNKIDKYSRLVFPSLFILFNVFYWGFYLMVPPSVVSEEP